MQRKKRAVTIMVEVTYRDDKKKTYRCSDMPFTQGGWITLAPEGATGRRLMIPGEGVAVLDYWLEAK